MARSKTIRIMEPSRAALTPAARARLGDLADDPDVLRIMAEIDDEDWDDDDFGDFDAYDDDVDEVLDAILPPPLTPRELLAGGRAPGDEKVQDLLAQALEIKKIPQLREIAAAMGWKLSGQRREDVLASLLAHYGSEASMAQARGRLRPEDIRFIGLVRALQLDTSTDLAAAVGAIARTAPADQAGTNWNALRLEAYRRGLILERDNQLIYPPGLYDGTPAGAEWLPVARDLDRLTVIPAPDPLRALALWAEAIAGEEQAFSRQAPWGTRKVEAAPGWQPGRPLVQWPTDRAARATVIPPVGSSFMPQTLRRVQDCLALSRTSAADLMHGLFSLLAGISVDDPETVTDPGQEAIRLALRLDGRDYLQLLWKLWSGLPYGMYDEWSWVQLEASAASFRLERQHSWAPDFMQFQGELINFRQSIGGRIIRRLRRADPGRDGWLDLDGFLRLAGLVEPKSAMGGARGMWRMVDSQGRQIQSWDKGGELIWRYVIEVPLHCMGLVDLARDAAGKVRAIRLSRAERYLIPSEAPTALAETEARWTEADSLDLPISLDHLPLLNSLNLCFELQAVKGGRASFRLDPAACQASFRAGAEGADIQRALADRQLALPAAASDTLDRWSAAWGHWVLRPGWPMLTFADEATAGEVMAAAPMVEQLVCRLSPTCWLVNPGQVDAVLAALQRSGHRPMVRDGAAPAADDASQGSRS